MTPSLPPPTDRDLPLGVLVAELVALVGEPAVVRVCLDLLGGARREDHVDELGYLTGLSFAPGEPTLDESSWKPYWTRSWGARGLLYAWEDSAAPAVVVGLDDEHWRVAETCLKVATRRELGEAGPGAVRLLGHELDRVRAQALRTLGAAGDTEHVEAVRALLHDPHPDVRRQAGRALERMGARLDLPA
ncbi:HEAT repeat domain-containing protein [Nocardioides sp. KIGAM211]|uniref:HEAT repeat domain-containing protein n=1 Tax=Nocardioides luti TaxID=2761101 RepID=A0A7X0RIF8_9ACTN|nr:HEAT repeat domain-containing protein [Nocardioides luti]